MTLEKLNIQKEEKTIKLLKTGVWVYIILLIFEGALRKWVFPFLATPLLLVRDPVALWMIYLCWKRNLFPSNFYIFGMGLITMLSVCFSLIFGHGNLGVSLYGARILLIHFPLIFIIGKFFNREDVVQVGRVFLWIALPMVVLIGLQFFSPQSAWVNRGIGGDMAGAGFSGANGYFRPPGTFSFTTGNVLFFSFIASWVFYFWSSKEKINRYLLIASTLALLASISFSISRTLFFSIGVTLLFTLVAVSRKPEYLGRILGAMVVVAMLLFVLSQIEFFQTGTEAFTSRFEVASRVEGGVSESLFHRFFGYMIGAVVDSNDIPFFGHGIGMGTNVGSRLLTGGTNSFLIAEGEWSRVVGERGFVLGILTLLIRLAFCFSISFKSYFKLKTGDLLPWLLLSFGIVVILKGQWAQPTVLGFSTIAGGLILACFSSNDLEIPDKNT